MEQMSVQLGEHEESSSLRGGNKDVTAGNRLALSALKFKLTNWHGITFTLVCYSTFVVVLVLCAITQAVYQEKILIQFTIAILHFVIPYRFSKTMHQGCVLFYSSLI